MIDAKTTAATGGVNSTLPLQNGPLPPLSRIPFPTNVSLEELGKNLFHVVAERDHGEVLTCTATQLIDCYVRYKLALPDKYCAAFSIFEQGDMSLERIQLFGESLFEKMSAEEIRDHFPLGNRNAIFSYLFFLLKKYHNEKGERYDHSKKVLEGFFNRARIGRKEEDFNRSLFRMDLGELEPRDQRYKLLKEGVSIENGLQKGAEFTEALFKYCMKKGCFPLFFERGFTSEAVCPVEVAPLIELAEEIALYQWLKEEFAEELVKRVESGQQLLLDDPVAAKMAIDPAMGPYCDIALKGKLTGGDLPQAVKAFFSAAENCVSDRFHTLLAILRKVATEEERRALLATDEFRMIALSIHLLLEERAPEGLSLVWDALTEADGATAASGDVCDFLKEIYRAAYMHSGRRFSLAEDEKLKEIFDLLEPLLQKSSAAREERMERETLAHLDYLRGRGASGGNGVQALMKLFEIENLPFVKVKQYGELLFERLPEKEEPIALASANLPLLFGYLSHRCTPASLPCFEKIYRKAADLYYSTIEWSDLLSRFPIAKILEEGPHSPLWKDILLSLQLCRGQIAGRKREIREALEPEALAFYDYCLNGELLNSEAYARCTAFLEGKGLSPKRLSLYGKWIFGELIPAREEQMKVIDINNPTHLYGYLLYQLDEQYRGKMPAGEGVPCKYNWIRLQLEGYYLLLSAPTKFAELYLSGQKPINSDNFIPYGESGINMGINMAYVAEKPVDKVKEHLLMGPDCLKEAFQHALKNQRFDNLFEEGFDYKRGNGSIEDRYNTLQEYVAKECRGILS